MNTVTYEHDEDYNNLQLFYINARFGYLLAARVVKDKHPMNMYLYKHYCTEIYY